jgi:hypothetical protein
MNEMYNSLNNINIMQKVGTDCELQSFISKHEISAG